MSLLHNGMILEQHKEPALGREILVCPAEAEYFDCAPSDELSVRSLSLIARLAGITDERDGLPLDKKLSSAARFGKLSAIIADAIDDEPYVSSRLCLIIHRREFVARGLELVAKAFGVRKTFMIVYKNITDISIRIPNSVGNVPVKRIRGNYPAENRPDILGNEKERRLVIGAGALLHLARAFDEHRKCTTAFITVAGNCVASPKNLEVPLGISAAQALELCDISLTPSRVVTGGSMTGESITDPENTPVTATTRAVLAFEDKNVLRTFSCIGCSRCIEVCPRHLNPQMIYRYVVSEKYDELSGFGIDACNECGACSYVCPSELDLSAKAALGKKQAKNSFVPAGTVSREEKKASREHKKAVSKLKRRRRRYLFISDVFAFFSGHKRKKRAVKR